MILKRRCLECGKEYNFDPADGLPRYCRDCYYALGLGDGPDLGEMYNENWQGENRNQVEKEVKSDVKFDFHQPGD